MTIFGRDSLLTSWMLLPLDARVARGTLQTLAETQGTGGRTPHRGAAGPDPPRDPLRAAGRRGRAASETVYYGTVDATPLFVMLARRAAPLGLRTTPDVEPAAAARPTGRWTGSRTTATADGDGFVEYERATDRGLVNQGWKDSFDGITLCLRAPSPSPRSRSAEVQGYVYAALLARARLARAARDDDRAPAS